MLRSYDNRVRRTYRSDTVYLECKEVVGETKVIFQRPPDGERPDAENDESLEDEDRFWNENKSFKIISTPYRDGGHLAKSFGAFLPIIEQLEKLHEAGFVHGDIRAFNTVFGLNETEGWLIDFDFGGKITNSPKYPPGYRSTLDDGRRRGSEKGVITKWHDWYALFYLIFEVHSMRAPPFNDLEETKTLSYEIQTMKTNFGIYNTDEQIEALIPDLKNLIRRLIAEKWKVIAEGRFGDVLESATKPMPTKPTATGSPPK